MFLIDLGIVYFSSDFLLPSIHIYGSYGDFNFGNLIWTSRINTPRKKNPCYIVLVHEEARAIKLGESSQSKIGAECQTCTCKSLWAGEMESF